MKNSQPTPPTPYELGYKAREKCDTRNPYPAGTAEHAQWLAGHNDRDDELAW